MRWHRGCVTNRRERRRDVLFLMPTATALLRRTGRGPSGGAENQVLLLARELARRNLRVAIAAIDDGGGLVTQLDGVDVLALPSSPTRAPLLRTVVFWALLAHTLVANPSTAVVQRSANIHTAPVALIARLLRRRFVFAAAGLRDFDRAPWKRRHRWLFDLGVRMSDRTVVQSEEQVRLGRERFGREPFLIRSIAERTERTASGRESFLWVGRLGLHKRPLAYLELARAVPEARFRMVVGKVPAYEQGIDLVAFERLAAQLANLELVPARRRAELLTLYESAVAVVSTSVSEGMPNVFLEGWSRGVPAIALSHDPDGVIERERLGAFAGGSETKLVEITRSMWQQRDDLDEFASRCRAYAVREHAIEHVADQWVQVLGLR